MKKGGYLRGEGNANRAPCSLDGGEADGEFEAVAAGGERRSRCYLRVVVDIKTAVANSMELAKLSLGSSRTTGLRLEEIESSNLDGQPVWLVALSNLPDGSSVVASLFPAYGADAAREYKTFAAAKNSGEVLSMKIRLLAVPS